MGWWKRNRWALIALVPVVALALVASSFRFVNLYLPWFSEHTRHTSGAIELPSEQFLVDLPGGHEYRATLTPWVMEEVAEVVEPASISPTTITPAPGARLWRVIVRVEADPAMVLYGCELALVDEDGVVYSPTLGKLRNGEPYLDFGADSCVPTFTPGPGMSLTNEYEPPLPGEERPSIYEVETFVAVPAGITPMWLRVSAPVAPAWQTLLPAEPAGAPPADRE